MQGVIRQSQRGFGRIVAGSVILHVAVISLALILYGFEPQRRFIPPSFTVDIISFSNKPAAGNITRVHEPETAPVLKEKTPPAKAPLKPAKTANIKETVKPVGTAHAKEALRPAPAPPANEKALTAETSVNKTASVDEAIKHVAESVRKKAEAERVASRIEMIKRRLEIDARHSKTPSVAGKTSVVASAPAHAGTPSERSASLESKYPAYYSAIRDRVQARWQVYGDEFKNDNVSIIVSIKIGRSGALYDSWVEKTSGNAVFDQSLLDAARKAAPFPPLPEDFKDGFLETGLRFCPQCKD